MINKAEKNKEDLIYKRKAYMKIMKEVFEKSFDERFTDSVVEKHIKKQITKGGNSLDVVIATNKYSNVDIFPYYHTVSMSMDIEVKEACYKKMLGVFPKQFKYLDIDINELITDLIHFNILDYNNLIVDTIKDSSTLKDFKKRYTDKGYKVEIIHNQPTKSSCTIRLIWS